MEPNTTSSKKEKKQQTPVLERPQLIKHLIQYFKYAGILFLVWNVGYWRFSPSWVLLALFFYMLNEEYRKTKDAKLDFARVAMKDEKQAILARIEELPSWVFFPDVERAEWLNKMIYQMWPFIGVYIQNVLKNSVQPAVENSLPKSLKPFKFEKIDLGDVPPRIGGVKVYIENLKRDEIILDLELFFSSDSNIKVAVRGMTAGIKNLTLHGQLRVVMKPLVSLMPIIGGMNVFFLNPPSLDFDLTNYANVLDMPLLSNTLRSVLVDQINYYLVLPNKIPIRLVDNINVDALRYPIPQGVLRLHIIAGRELKRADVKVIGKGKSDPYCKVYVGAQVFTTKVIKDTIAPTWNAYFEAVVDQKHGQFVEIECLDEDPGDDDELGVATIDIQNVAEKGNIDTWLPLEGVDTGMIHIRALWLHLSRDMDDLDRVVQQNNETHLKSGSEDHLASALLMVNIDSAKNLPRSKKSMSEPSPFVKLSVGNASQKSVPKPKTTDPKWEENFHFLVNDPRNQDLTVEMYNSNEDSGFLWDSNKDKKLGNLNVPLASVLKAPKMTIHRTFQLKDSGPQAMITLRLCMRVLTTEKPEDWEEDIPEQPNAGVKNPGDPGTSVDGEPGAPKAPEPVSIPETPPADPTPAAKPAPPAQPQPAAKQTTASVSPTATETVKRETSPTQSAAPPAVVERSGSDLRQRSVAAPPGPKDPGLGKIQMTFRYSQQRSKLICSVHKCVGLIPCDDENNSDPYVRIYLMPGHKEKRKTQVVKNNLNPTFDETFDWSLNWKDIPTTSLEVRVKNSTGVFSSEKKEIGQVNIDLSNIDLTKSYTDWFVLQEPDD